MIIELLLLLVLILPLAQIMMQQRRRLFPMPRPVVPHPGPGGGPAILAQADGPADDGPDTEPGFHPTAMDVVLAKAMLQRALRLPAELVNTIVDYAEYWPHSTSVTSFHELPQRELKILGGRPAQENRFILRSRPLGFIKPPQYEVDRHPSVPAEPRRLTNEYPVEQFQQWIGSPVPPTKTPCRKVVFTIHSHDQGWGGRREHHGTYEGSWTWFEVGLERFDMANACDENCPEHKASRSAGHDAAASDASEDHASASTSESSEPGPPTPGSSHSDQDMPDAPVARTSFQKKRDEQQQKLQQQQEHQNQQQQTNLPACSLRPVIPQLEPTDNPDTPLRLHHGLLPSPETKIQANVTAHRTTKVHRVEWSWTDDVHPESPEADELDREGRGRATGTGSFVRDLKLGDVVTVWAKARFPMWVNHVQKVQIDVYWAL